MNLISDILIREGRKMYTFVCEKCKREVTTKYTQLYDYCMECKIEIGRGGDERVYVQV